METGQYKVAVVQTDPHFPPSKKDSIQKVIKIIDEAGSKGARIIVFPETFIPAYPNWAIEAKPPLNWYEKSKKLVEESVFVPGPETESLCKAAKSSGAIICIGINERDRERTNVIYNSLIFINDIGKILGTHRKLTPVYREKVFWKSGKPNDLNCVFKTNYGIIGGLICAEHLNPLLKSAMFIQQEQIHVACYPGWSLLPRDIMQSSIRQYAIESQCYVLASSQYIKGKPENSDDMEANWSFYGGSAIIDPMGNYLAGPSYEKDEILYADIDLSKILERKIWIDMAGKDGRWDVISYLLDRSRELELF